MTDDSYIVIIAINRITMEENPGKLVEKTSVVS